LQRQQEQKDNDSGGGTMDTQTTQTKPHHRHIGDKTLSTTFYCNSAAQILRRCRCTQQCRLLQGNG
jgi:hypothetical protein